MNTVLVIDDDVLIRLTGLMEDTGQSLSVVLARLLNREPHDHPHVCPTCARLAHTQPGRHDEPLFV